MQLGAPVLMGTMKPSDMRQREFEKGLQRARSARRFAPEATPKQLDFIITLGEHANMTPHETLAWCIDLIVPSHSRTEVTCLADLRKTEASEAIERL